MNIRFGINLKKNKRTNELECNNLFLQLITFHFSSISVRVIPPLHARIILPRWFESQSSSGASEAQRDAGEAMTQTGSKNVKCMEGWSRCKTNWINWNWGPLTDKVSRLRARGWDIVRVASNWSPVDVWWPTSDCRIGFKGLLCQEERMEWVIQTSSRLQSCDATRNPFHYTPPSKEKKKTCPRTRYLLSHEMSVSKSKQPPNIRVCDIFCLTFCCYVNM